MAALSCYSFLVLHSLPRLTLKKKVFLCNIQTMFYSFSGFHCLAAALLCCRQGQKWICIQVSRQPTAARKRPDGGALGIRILISAFCFVKKLME